jgi:hypothetical protein
MSLATKIHSSFWSDEGVGALPPDQKLAVAWVLTSKDTNNLGYLKVQKRQFEFDTNLPLMALEGALMGLPRTFLSKRDEQGLRVLALSYIHYQFSDAATNPNNRLQSNLVKLLLESDDWVQAAILGRYKGLVSPFLVAKGDASSFKGPEQNRTEKSSADLHRSVQPGGAGGAAWAEVPTDADVFAFCEKWTGEPASGAPLIPKKFAEKWIARMAGRQMWPASWERKLIADWRAEFSAWGKTNGAAPPARTLLDKKTRLEALRRQIANHPGNPEGNCGFMGDPGAEDIFEFEALLKEKAVLEKEIAGNG